MNIYKLIENEHETKEGTVAARTVGVAVCATMAQATRKLMRAHNVNPKEPMRYSVVFEKSAKHLKP